MAPALSRCTICGCGFRPNRYNPERQHCCGRPKCVRALKRLRQREWYARRCRDDPNFAEKALKRCAAANRRRRERQKASAALPPPCLLPEMTAQALFEVVSGFLSQVTDTTDPAELSASLRDYRERGRRLALGPAVTAPDG
jgi:hypothetical protein